MFYNVNEVIMMIPKKYEIETDYRKIPREYLNKNIPQGRGMIKWRPFVKNNLNITCNVSFSTLYNIN